MTEPAKKPRILVVANQKGGVGKTTTAINLGTALAAIGEPTLVIDIDPQGNASTGLGVPRSERKLTTYDVLMGEATIGRRDRADAAFRACRWCRRRSICPAPSWNWSTCRGAISSCKDALAEYSAHGSSSFSYVLIDCPPSLTLLTVNAMVAADAVMVPLQCEFFALEGFSQLLKTIELVRAISIPRWKSRASC